MSDHTDYFREAADQMRSYGRKLLRKCELCGEIIPWGYIELKGTIMCQECYEKISMRSKG